MPLLFDSHLDLAWNALTWKRDLRQPLAQINESERAMTDELFRGRATTCLPEMRRGGLAVCLATVMGRVPYGEQGAMHGSTLDFPAHANVYGFARGMAAYYQALQRQGEVRLIGTREQLTDHWQSWNDQTTDRASQPVGIVLAMEGADAICDPDWAEEWFATGLRVAGLVHYGASRYATGTGQEGPLTNDGRRLLDEFRRLGIILDTTHLCDQSFVETMNHFEGPVLASHQNCRALVPGQRQFSDEQLREVIARDGIIGTALDAWMLYPNWQRGATSPQVVTLRAVADQIDHVCQLAGDDRHAAIGSDLDGGFGTEQTPGDLHSIADLQNIAQPLADRGYGDRSIRRILGENWLSFFQRHLPPTNRTD